MGQVGNVLYTGSRNKGSNEEYSPRTKLIFVTVLVVLSWIVFYFLAVFVLHIVQELFHELSIVLLTLDKHLVAASRA